MAIYKVLNESNIDIKDIINKYFNSDQVDIATFKNIGELNKAMQKDIQSILSKLNRDSAVKKDLNDKLDKIGYVDEDERKECKSLINRGIFKLVDSQDYWALDGEETEQWVRSEIIYSYLLQIGHAISSKYNIHVDTGDGDEGSLYPETLDYSDSMTIEEFRNTKNKKSEEPKKKKGFFSRFMSKREQTELGIFSECHFLNEGLFDKFKKSSQKETIHKGKEITEQDRALSIKDSEKLYKKLLSYLRAKLHNCDVIGDDSEDGGFQIKLQFKDANTYKDIDNPFYDEMKDALKAFSKNNGLEEKNSDHFYGTKNAYPYVSIDINEVFIGAYTLYVYGAGHVLK